MLSSLYLRLAIIFLATTAANAFAAKKIRLINQASSSMILPHQCVRSRSSLSSALRDETVTRSNRRAMTNRDEIWSVALCNYKKKAPHLTEKYILHCITNVTGLEADDVNDAIDVCKTVAECADLGELPRMQAEIYYEHLKILGIPVRLCKDED